jgi:hypothetical protein
MKGKRKCSILFLFAIITLGGLWLGTAFYGVPATRTKHMVENNLNAAAGALDITYTNITTKTLQTFPWFYCRAAAIAPLIVKVDYAYASGPIGGSGGAAYYLWFFGYSRLMTHRNEWST